MPCIHGNPIYFDLRPSLSAYRGKLLFGAGTGTPVHAAAFIRKRAVVLETGLFSEADRLRSVLIHEIFHFVWARLGNNQRRAFADLLKNEVRGKARGEAGESSGLKKQQIQKQASLNTSSRLWRDYICESFCDSAAAFFSGGAADEHFTLAERWAKRRYQLLLHTGEQGWRC